MKRITLLLIIQVLISGGFFIQHARAGESKNAGTGQPAKDSLPAFLYPLLQADSNLLVAACTYKSERWYALHQYSDKTVTSSTNIQIRYYNAAGELKATFKRQGGFISKPTMEPANIRKDSIVYYVPDTVLKLCRKAGARMIEICNHHQQIIYLIRKSDYGKTTRNAPLFTDAYYDDKGRAVTTFQYIRQWNLPRQHLNIYRPVCTVIPAKPLP
ncbi:hypothetical protein HHL16_22885 [Pseudoflavitalea sp. G-6-1-2]|uniref:hypothetical protein n=1 Tax=Pseudoflavitalea sp. G-6-1-2 TaxID=2728841 RepID=UPI001469E179|nr:hypothetical protein [Pseudoflavitalea sp. G-6-1-2]NML23745.1 hypothetical protein [Pseudoflavitalea sp. G-6-1-2]